MLQMTSEDEASTGEFTWTPSRTTSPPGDTSDGIPFQAPTIQDTTRIGVYPIGDPERPFVRISRAPPRRLLTTNEDTDFQDTSNQSLLPLSAIAQAREEQGTVNRTRFLFSGNPSSHPTTVLFIQEQYTFDIPRTLGPWKPYRCYCPECLDSQTPLYLYRYLGDDTRNVPPEAWTSLRQWIREQHVHYQDRRHVVTPRYQGTPEQVLLVFVVRDITYIPNPLWTQTLRPETLEFILTEYTPSAHGQDRIYLREVHPANRTVPSFPFGMWKPYFCRCGGICTHGPRATSNRLLIFVYLGDRHPSWYHKELLQMAVNLNSSPVNFWLYCLESTTWKTSPR